jgi:hypothetical protein
MGIEQGDDRAFYLLGEQIGRMTEELIAQREAHFALVEKFSQQSALLAKLTERIDAHNRLIEERKNTDHSRIGALEASHAILADKVGALERWKWKIVGITAGLLLSLEAMEKLIAWITST